MKPRTSALRWPVLAALALAACADSATSVVTPGDGASDIVSDLGADTVSLDTPRDLGVADTLASDANDAPTADAGEVSNDASLDATTDATDARDASEVTPVDVGCPDGQTSCGAGPLLACVTLASDARNCGACGTACLTGQTCTLGVCGCPTGQTRCGDSCVDTASNNAHCGSCGRECGTEQTCAMGVCTCPGGFTLCGTRCVDTFTSNADCGTCGTACPTAQTCVGGACACPTGQSLCAGLCVTTATSESHCGTCGRMCASGQSCVMGACACPSGQTLCGDRCVDTSTSDAHCGACGNACPGRQVCASGRCALTCTAPATVCGTSTEMYCANVSTDRDNCGGCARACATPAGASTTACVSGACSPVCNDPLADCDRMFTNGCETDTARSTLHCGGCGRACPASAAMASSVVCTAGACRPVCATGFGDCDGAVTNGCEVDITASVTHCGACGRACATGAACADGTCLARSCREAQTLAPTAPSGIFRLDPDGTGAGAAMDVYCDMATAGGGWTLLATFYNSTPSDTRRWITDEIFVNGVTFGTLAARATDDFKSPAYTAVAANDMLVFTDEYHFGFNGLLGGRNFGAYVTSQVTPMCSTSWIRSGVDFASSNLSMQQQRLLSFAIRGLDLNGGGAIDGCAVRGTNENAFLDFLSGPSWWVFGAGNCVACAGGWTTYDNGMLNLASISAGACTSGSWPCNSNGLWWQSSVYPANADTKTRYLQILVR